VEITLHTKGPVIRAEAASEHKSAAFDLALDKLMAQLRRAADRKRVHRGTHKPASLAEASGHWPTDIDGRSADGMDSDQTAVRTIAGMEVQGEGPLVVREKTHQAAPMTLCEALDAMELVGHDFYLFIDKELQVPSVVYRRRGYDYGVIRLENVEALVHA
jgi:hypothetical protein